MRRLTSRPDRRRPAPELPAPPAAIPAVGLAAAAVLGLALLLAPPESNFVWALDAWRSLPWNARLLLLGAAAAAVLPVTVRWRGALEYALVALGILIAAAFSLRESIHFLGDTQLRLRSLSAFSEGIVTSPFAEWSSRLHAAPLDTVANLLAPLVLVRGGLGVRDALALTGVALGLATFTALWRMAARAGVPAHSRVPLALALAANGIWLAFASYAESAALLAAVMAWWWAEMLAPLDRRAQPVRLAVAWVAVLLAHRVGLLLALPMAWRAFGPPRPGDVPAERRVLAGASLLALLVASLLAFALGAGGQFARDAADLAAAVRAGALWRVAPTDVLNAIVLVAPLACLAPWIAGREACRRFLRSPDAGLFAAAVLPLFVVVTWLLPLSGNGLGLHRDWDANIPLGTTLGAAAAVLLAGAPAARLRGGLIVALPVLALLGGGWLAVNADADAAGRRALALAERAPRLPELQRSHVFLFLGQRAMDGARFAEGARAYERSFALAPNPRRALLAAEAWLAAGDREAARRMIAAARARGELEAELRAGAARLESMFADTTGARPAR